MGRGSSRVASQRLFFALVPDRSTINRLEKVQRTLKSSHGIRARAVNPSLFHVTLAFLGQQSVGILAGLLALASRLEMPACRVQMDCIGSFRRSGVVWLGARKPPPELSHFQGSLQAELEQAGISFDRKPWKFHMTLYRDLRTPLVRMEPDTVSWDLEGFSLMESVSIDRGVKYSQLGHWKSASSAIDRPDM